MFFAAEASKEQACYVRFFNGALGVAQADIYVNGDLFVSNLAHGAITPFHKAKAGAYNIEVRLKGEGTDMDYSELVSLMEGVAYTLAFVGDPNHLSMAIITMDMSRQALRPNVRFANLLSHDMVVDIQIDEQKAVPGLMFREVSEEIQIQPGSHKITIFNSDDEIIFEDEMEVKTGNSYLALISGDVSNPQNPPQMHVAEDAPIL